MKSIIAFTVTVVIALILSLIYRVGGFKSVALTEGTRGPTKIVYKLHVGAYHEIVPVLESVEKWAKENGEPCKSTFGEYIDNPDKVAEDRLRSNGGCVVQKVWSKGLPEGFKYREIPAHDFVVAEFDGAPSIGPIKVYPRAKDYIEEHSLAQTGPSYEFYEIRPADQVKTTYWFPVVKAGVIDPTPVSDER